MFRQFDKDHSYFIDFAQIDKSRAERNNEWIIFINNEDDIKCGGKTLKLVERKTIFALSFYFCIQQMLTLFQELVMIRFNLKWKPSCII